MDSSVSSSTSGSKRLNINIYGGQVVTAENYLQQVSNHDPQRQGELQASIAAKPALNNIKADILLPLELRVASSALHDSAERCDPPKCFPQTRTAVLRKIRRWARNKRDISSPSLLWLSGPVGAGKTAIAQTLAEHWSKDGVLAATFFFSKSDSLRNAKTHVITTIAYQLLQAFPDIRPYLEKAIRDEPFIFKKQLSAQIEALIIHPLQAAYPISRPRRPKVIIVDGLDECLGQGSQKELLNAFTILLNQHDIPLVVLVASRPEFQIRDAFARSDLEQLTTQLVLNDDFNPGADIAKYLSHKFDEIKAGSYIQDPAWPPRTAIKAIVDKSSGQFIYAATVIKYVGTPGNDPRHCLQVILGIKDPGHDTPYSQLDALYIHILASVGVSSCEAAMDIFAFLQCEVRDVFQAKTHSYLGSNMPLLQKVLLMDQEHLYRHLMNLHSILFVPPLQDAQTQSIRFYHASLGEFLADRRRSGKYFLDLGDAHARMARCFFRHLLVGMSSASVDLNEGHWPALKDEAIRHLREATPTCELKVYIYVAIAAHSDDTSKGDVLETLGLDNYEARQSLFEVLLDCNHRAEVLRYLKRCINAQNPGLTQRMIRKMMLAHYHVRSYLESRTCRGDLCARHWYRTGYR